METVKTINGIQVATNQQISREHRKISINGNLKYYFATIDTNNNVHITKHVLNASFTPNSITKELNKIVNRKDFFCFLEELPEILNNAK